MAQEKNKVDASSYFLSRNDIAAKAGLSGPRISQLTKEGKISKKDEGYDPFEVGYALGQLSGSSTEFVTQAEFAEYFNISQQRVSQLIQEDVLRFDEVSGTRKLHFKQSCQAMAAYYNKRIDAASSQESRKAEAEIELKLQQARREKNKNRLFEKKVLLTEDVETLIDDFFFEMVAILRAHPDRVAVQLAPAMKPEQVSEIERSEMDSYMERLQSHRFDRDTYFKRKEEWEATFEDEDEDEE